MQKYQVKCSNNFWRNHFKIRFIDPPYAFHFTDPEKYEGERDEIFELDMNRDLKLYIRPNESTIISGKTSP